MENTKATEDLEDPAIVAQKGYETLMSGEPHAYAPKMQRETFISSISSNEAIAEKAHKIMEPSEKRKIIQNRV